MEKLGNPHEKFKSIYVTGTNGKGSVCETLFAVLTNSGYKTGKFMSPFLLELSEYIVIDDNQINGKEIEEYLKELKPLIDEKQKAGVFVTFWEVITSLAFMHFAKNKVDIAIIETGIESPVDCTNIIDSLVTIITKVDIDHETLLGHTVEENMREVMKCIKPNIPVISANNLKKVLINDDDFSDNFSGGNLLSAPYILKVKAKDAKNYQTPLKGKFQKENLALSLKCFEQLCEKGFDITNEQIHEGLKKIKHNARFETISIFPKVIFDGCHNANSVGAFTDILKENFAKDENKVLIVSLLKDKDINSFMKEFAKGMKKVKNAKIIFTSGTSVIMQGGSSGVFYSSQELKEVYGKYIKNLKRKKIQLTEMSFEEALSKTDNESTTFIIGSFKTYPKSLEILSKQCV